MNVAIPVASSGIAATLLDGGRTVHSVLKLRLNLNYIEYPTCNIIKNRNSGSLLLMYKLLVWDECTMSYKHVVEALIHSLQDIPASRRLLSGIARDAYWNFSMPQ